MAQKCISLLFLMSFGWSYVHTSTCLLRTFLVKLRTCDRNFTKVKLEQKVALQEHFTYTDKNQQQQVGTRISRGKKTVLRHTVLHNIITVYFLMVNNQG